MKNKIRKRIIRVIENAIVFILLFASLYCIGYVMAHLTEVVSAINLIHS